MSIHFDLPLIERTARKPLSRFNDPMRDLVSMTEEEIIDTVCLCTICKTATAEELRSYKSDPNASWEFLAHPSCAYQLGLVEWK